MKGITYTLRAFARVVSVFTYCRLRIVGDGPERDTAVSLASELGIAGKVTFLGALILRPFNARWPQLMFSPAQRDR